MGVSLFFGLPGCGKTTVMTKIAYDEVHRKKRKYKHIYSNVPLKIDGVTYIDNDCIGKYDLSDCMLLIDEATLFADNRDHKNFSKNKIEYFLEHRHNFADIFLFTQQWNGVDLKIRVITDRVFYVYKKGILKHWVTRYHRIPYDILIPKRGEGGEKMGDIIQGYCQPSFFQKVFSPRIWRPKYYPYFDSWIRRYYPPLPDKYQPYDSKNPIVPYGHTSQYKVNYQEVDNFDNIDCDFSLEI